MTTQARVLTLESDFAAAVRGAAPKRGFTSISRASYSSSSSSSGSSDQDTVDIPEVLNSRETLEFCGLNADVSSLIFESWSRLQQTQGPGQPGHGNDIVTEAKHYVRRMAEREGDAWRPDHDWRRALAAMGASQRLSDAILHSSYADLRNTASASYWVLDTIDLSAGTPSIMENRTFLYKGDGATRLIKVFCKRDEASDEKGHGSPSPSLDIARLLSPAPTDFHRTRDDMLYLFDDLPLASAHGKFASARVPAEEGGVLHFSVPTDLLHQNSIEISGSDGKKLASWARGPKRIGSFAVPTDLSRFVAAPVLVGRIYGMPGDKRVFPEASPSDPTGRCMKTGDGGDAYQYAFQDPQVLTQLQEKCRGRVWYQPVHAV